MVVKSYEKSHNDINISELAPANFVPAAAVIRWERALSIMTGRKGFVGGSALLHSKSQTELWKCIQDRKTGGKQR